MSLIVSDRFSLIIGLGKTGFACAQYLALQGERFQVADSRQHPPFFDQLTLEQPETPIHIGDFPYDLCVNADQIILSPGVSMQEPALVAAARAGVPIRSDVDIFAEAARLANVPIVAITGSNAKSTVTSLVGQMAKTAGLNVAVGGNLGEPSVSLLADNVDLYVMELSSFQLESTSGLGASVACVLNVSPDHMDRYDNLMSYHQAKHRIFQGCKAVVINGDDPLTNPLVPGTVTQKSFSLGDPDVGQFGLREEAGTPWMVQGLKPILAVNKLAMFGRHNVANALAALALGQAVGLPMEAMTKTLTVFTGLSHRCEWVADIDGVAYINDSKGTNIGATVAALEGLGPALTGKIMLIAGGLGKGADFSELVAPLSRYGKQVVLIGRDANDIEMALVGKVRCIHAQDMQSAVSIAHAQAVSGDLVLLSPACASFDAYANFEARGDHFSALVRALA
ncbi:UDP-N-acetylmuramoyl-L-alanine--D-glutamate ligase [Oceanospirillaceae bacterium]|jgi:UDP-N-acetylmuramoylalanine--D-glutamate ligase|nr:UDP-N-acetylmuramoyl-L-alanine--D-glutamate ligase [Oceanospirillaceae bacterium]MBT4998187.1 UDP-N-acetylmuramoyl-L-alanine--D-glutamate ligase [Oceanospirillaceae bacterium]MBT5629060.1 UDP-N-acetylmuramoyl-L-alanine--D-glutamate ligase [Oceanospirillaceae bacterium]MBT6099929.1 UDP-N-acetylmuramoyl-L-alanine--D-glutamate ligase [Oceanospirillaceae bacterium]MBT7673818.1 UDP-N-acetylmuramoyl-L-alanine--D-glutamate ligase [Oceanospirillaceae bacterium]